VGGWVRWHCVLRVSLPIMQVDARQLEPEPEGRGRLGERATVRSMCGRFVSSQTSDQIASFFGASFDEETSLPANYNVAPTNDVFAVVGRPDGPTVTTYQWGLVPSWAKDTKIGSKMINARSETIAEKPAFKRLFVTHRVLIPMDGFYEWRTLPPGEDSEPGNRKASPPRKQPMYITRRDGRPLAVAGLWAAWRDRSGDDPDAPWLHTCTVITTSANDTMSPVHDRMPVLIEEADWDRWLDPTNRDVEQLRTLLRPAANDVLTMHAVSTDVNNARNNGSELVLPVELV
jgi:putative SOS response-associated peptidase YedK